MNYKNIITDQFKEIENVINIFLSDEENISKIEKSAKIIINSLKNGGKVISCGNGGSMCDAMHFAEELSGKFRDDRDSYAAISISDPSYLSCVSNDFGYNMVFSRYIQSMGNDNDVLLAITTSGKSENVLKAIERAKMKNLKIIALTGKGGLDIHTKDYVDIEIKIPHNEYSDRIQEMHIKIIHILILLIEKGLEK